jgi:hypothetical protein
MRMLLLVMPLLLTGAGWRDDSVRVLAKGAISGVTRPGERVLRTPEAWQKAWDEYAAHVQPKPPLPAVDFGKEMVVAVFMGQRPTSGYAVEVTGVTRSGRSTVVSVRRSSPPPGAITAQIVTSPFTFVAIPASNRPVRFVNSDVGGRR